MTTKPAVESQPDPRRITKNERYREIMGVLARHGIGVFDDQFIKHEASDQARAEHLRRACEELGTMFIKLGQALSTRADLLPDVYRKEIAKLQDEVVPVPSKSIADVIREDLGTPPEQLFASFDPMPLGSASIGQVHAARLFDGREVVLKVRKPGVDELVRIDLEILGDLIDKWSSRFPLLQEYNARALLQEFKDVLLAEIDYSREAANIKLFRITFANDNGFKIPAVIEEFSKNRVLTEERVEGRKPSDTTGLPKRSRTLVSRRIARFVLEPAFEHGFYYADPHPGNLLIDTNGTLSIIDFGKVGRLTPEAQRRAADLFVAITRSDAQRLTDRLIEITAPDHPIDRDLITREIDRILELYVDVSLENVRFGEAISEVLQLVRRHGLRLPGALVQFFKALGMCEGILQTIDPDSSFSDYLRPLAGKLVYQAYAGPHLLERLGDSSAEAAELIVELPRRIDRILGEVERGNLRIWTRVEDIEPIVKRLEHVFARTNATLLAAACIVGLALLMQFYHPQGWQRWIGVVFWIAVAFAIIDYVRTLLTLRK
ncbi:MAG TPA: AarF/UbiB family protein [Terriglobales bacterium]